MKFAAMIFVTVMLCFAVVDTLTQDPVPEVPLETGGVTFTIDPSLTIITSSSAAIQIPMDGPAVPMDDKGEPCQLFAGASDPSPEPQSQNSGIRIWVSQIYEWLTVTAEVPDGLYIGILDVRDGRVLPCPSVP